MQTKILLLASLICLFGFTSCNDSNINTKNENNLQEGENLVNTLKGKWKWILTKEENSNEFTVPDENMIYNIIGIFKDTESSYESYQIDYEVYGESACSSENISSYVYKNTPNDLFFSFSMRIPYIDSRTVPGKFGGIKDKTSKDTLQFVGRFMTNAPILPNKNVIVYYAKIKN